jgi:Reverse transcriptase (RNA-dependent DNA polymerase)
MVEVPDIDNAPRQNIPVDEDVLLEEVSPTPNTKEELEEIMAALANTPVDLEYPDDPASLQEALDSSEADDWRKAMAEEFASIKEMGVYKLIPRSDVPKGRKIMKGRPVFHRKRDHTGQVIRYKCRYICRGFSAVYRQDYTKTTSPTMRMESFRVLLHIAASRGWDARQFDVKTAFLYGLLGEDEVCFMEQPTGYEEPGKEDWVWELQKGLYGMKQGGRVWNRTLHAAMVEWGFKRLECEYCIYYRKTEHGTIITGIHVDDFLSIASDKAENERFVNQLRDKWKIADLGEPTFCVGIAIERNHMERTVALSQIVLIDRVIAQFGLKDAYPVSTPMDPGLKLRRLILTPEEKLLLSRLPYRSLVGYLMWIALGSRPDIQFAVSYLSQFLDCYGQAHYDAAKRVLHYLKGTRDLKLHLGGGNVNLLGFTDASYANCLDTHRSMSGYCFSLGTTQTKNSIYFHLRGRICCS